MWLNYFETDAIWTAFQGFFEVTYSHFSILGFLMNFRDFWVFIFGYRAQNENPEITENLYFLVYNTPMHVDLYFDHYFNCLSVKTDIRKNGFNLYSERLKAFKTQIAAAWFAMWLNRFEIDVVWTALQLFLELHAHISVLWRFCRISVISDGKSLFLGYKAEMHVDLFYDHYFKFLRVKYDISKNELNLINLERSEALKRQIAATWSAMRLNHFEFDITWTVIQVFWSYILILQYYYVVFVEFSWLLSFRFWVYRAQNENLEITENLYFWSYKAQMNVGLFVITILNFWVLKLT